MESVRPRYASRFPFDSSKQRPRHRVRRVLHLQEDDAEVVGEEDGEREGEVYARAGLVRERARMLGRGEGHGSRVTSPGGAGRRSRR